jgi:hypothetical protein
MSGDGLLRDVLTSACAIEGCSAKDLTVLSVQIDPYRMDTPTGHAEGAWLAAQMARLPSRRFHLRGLHYALVSTTGLTKPNGDPYRNTEEDWLWLQGSAMKAARWLGYVPFDRISDERNAPPIIRISAEPSAPSSFISVGAAISVPEVGNLKPRVYLDDFVGRQAYHLVLYGEKTSLDQVLVPIAERYKACLYLPSGEISDTQLYQMASAGAEDGRPMVVFILADFDPSGCQMAVSIGRKLQALRDLLFPDLEFEIRPIALTEEQVRSLNLPSTPLKSTELRGDRWREAHGGLGQTEIDALATLQPNVLRRIVREALDPFFDHDLDDRVEAAEREWTEAAQAQLDEQLDDELLERIKSEAEQKLAAVKEEIERLNEALRTATADLDIDLAEPDVPEAEPPGGGGLPLLSSDWSWTDQTRALIDRKRCGNGGS